jgi:hypothetical protein
MESPNPSPPLLTCVRGIGLAKALEDVRQEFRGNALPGVLKGDHDVREIALQAYLHIPSLRCELDRVR